MVDLSDQKRVALTTRHPLRARDGYKLTKQRDPQPPPHSASPRLSSYLRRGSTSTRHPHRHAHRFSARLARCARSQRTKPSAPQARGGIDAHAPSVQSAREGSEPSHVVVPGHASSGKTARTHRATAAGDHQKNGCLATSATPLATSIRTADRAGVLPRTNIAVISKNAGLSS